MLPGNLCSVHSSLQGDFIFDVLCIEEYTQVDEECKKVSTLFHSLIKVALYSEICLVFMFNGGSSSSLIICPIDKKSP